jgi:hypothetical protein
MAGSHNAQATPVLGHTYVRPLDHVILPAAIGGLQKSLASSLSKELWTPSGRIYNPIMYMGRLARLQLIRITIWFIWWKIICSDPLCYSIPLWSWAWLIFVSSSLCSWGHGRSHVASNHVNLICVPYFDGMYVVIPLVVTCERRLHDTSSYLGLRECIVE